MRIAVLLLVLVVSSAFPVTALAESRLQLAPQFLSIEAGYGMTLAFKGSVPRGDGFYASVAYVLVPSAWVRGAAYAGTALTFSGTSSGCREAGLECDVSTKIGFLGIKGRLTIPIPFVAPFLELGIGTSIGEIRTRTRITNE